MPRLLPNRFRVECIREFELAAERRHAEAIALADAGHRTGAIYLFGYVVEMSLKVAFLRLAGHADDETTTPAVLWGYLGQRPNSVARSLGLAGSANLHDISAWAALIVAYRSHHSRDYPEASFATVLRANVTIVHQRWTEAIRYHGNVAYPHELNRVRTACDWVTSNRSRL